MSRLRDLDYKNNKITKPGWRNSTKVRYLKWVERPYDPVGLYVYDVNGNSLHELGYVGLDDKLLDSEGWGIFDV